MAANSWELAMSGVPWRRPLVVGASGQVGAELCRVLEEHGTKGVFRAGRSGQDGVLPFDLAAVKTPSDTEKVFGAMRPDLILCAGAMTFVDGCQAQPEEAFRANAYGPSMLASYARSLCVPFVFFSSDYVFDGFADHPGPYAEEDATRPLNVYGQSKLEGERAVLEAHPQALVVRTSWVYGPDAAGKNFISGLVRQLRAGQRVRVPSDQVSTPTYNRDLAGATLALVEAGASGVVHVAGPEVMSRLELARAVAAFFSLDGALLDGVLTAELAQRAVRPLRSGLRTERADRWLRPATMRSLQEGLAETAARLSVGS